MKYLWMICMIVVTGLTSTSANDCSNNTNAEECYADLVNYESIVFPLYGADRAELEDTCGNINMSMECLESYSQTCYGSPDCDEECKDLLKHIHAFMANTGLLNLAQDLCTEDNPVQDIYLENYKCLEKNEVTYMKCHEQSKQSQIYMNKIRIPEDAIKARCCYFSWYFNCFMNVTRDKCSINATYFVEYGLQKLVGHISSILCKDFKEVCGDRPPMPPPEDEDENENDEDENTTDKVVQSGSLSLKSSIMTMTGMILCIYIALM